MSSERTAEESSKPYRELEKHIGAALHVMRVLRRMTQVQLAALLAKHESSNDDSSIDGLQAYISKIENGRIGVSWERLASFCSILQISPSELIAIAEEHMRKCQRSGGDVLEAIKSQSLDYTLDLKVTSLADLPSSARRVYTNFKAMIICEAHSDGHMWLVDEIAKRFHCRASTVSAAIDKLAQDGLVARFGKSRVGKIGYDVEYVRGLIRARLELEYDAIRRLCSMLKLDFSRLDAIHNKMARIDCSSESQLLEFVEYDVEFHRTLFVLAGAEHLVEEITSLTRQIIAGIGAMSDEHRPKDILIEHERLLNAIKDNNPAVAFASLRDHLISGARVARKDLEQKLEFDLPQDIQELCSARREPTARPK